MKQREQPIKKLQLRQNYQAELNKIKLKIKQSNEHKLTYRQIASQCDLPQQEVEYIIQQEKDQFVINKDFIQVKPIFGQYIQNKEQLLDLIIKYEGLIHNDDLDYDCYNKLTDYTKQLEEMGKIRIVKIQKDGKARDINFYYPKIENMDFIRSIDQEIPKDFINTGKINENENQYMKYQNQAFKDTQNQIEFNEYKEASRDTSRGGQWFQISQQNMELIDKKLKTEWEEYKSKVGRKK